MVRIRVRVRVRVRVRSRVRVRVRARRGLLRRAAALGDFRRHGQRRAALELG